jgi:hypothetical protein
MLMTALPITINFIAAFVGDPLGNAYIKITSTFVLDVLPCWLIPVRSAPVRWERPSSLDGKFAPNVVGLLARPKFLLMSMPDLLLPLKQGWVV